MWDPFFVLLCHSCRSDSASAAVEAALVIKNTNVDVAAAAIQPLEILH